MKKTLFFTVFLALCAQSASSQKIKFQVDSSMVGKVSLVQKTWSLGDDQSQPGLFVCIDESTTETIIVTEAQVCTVKRAKKARISRVVVSRVIGRNGEIGTCITVWRKGWLGNEKPYGEGRYWIFNY